MKYLLYSCSADVGPIYHCTKYSGPDGRWSWVRQAMVAISSFQRADDEARCGINIAIIYAEPAKKSPKPQHRCRSPH